MGGLRACQGDTLDANAMRLRTCLAKFQRHCAKSAQRVWRSALAHDGVAEKGEHCEDDFLVFPLPESTGDHLRPGRAQFGLSGP